MSHNCDDTPLPPAKYAAALQEKYLDFVVVVVVVVDVLNRRLGTRNAAAGVVVNALLANSAAQQNF